MHASSTTADLSQQHIEGWGLRAFPACLSLGVISLTFAATLGAIEGDDFRTFSFRYVFNYTFFLNIMLGSLFFACIQHIVRAGWSVVVRRMAEVTGLLVIPWAVLFLPILLPVIAGHSPLYEWNHADVVASDALLTNKAPYLNSTFFTIRWIFYFALWSFIAVRFFSWSRSQDRDGKVLWTETLEQWSGPAVIGLALTATFGAFDMLMSLDAHWFSTIYGVYFFAGSMVSFLASTILAVSYFQSRGLLKGVVTVEHIHDLGKLLFGFNCFWAYIAFSQYLLIWYSNIPEETQWYARRQDHGWQYISILLIVGHFAVPFLGLMSRDVKRSLRVLKWWAAWLLFMHYIDLFWLVIPELSPSGPSLGLIDLSCFIGFLSFFVGGWLWMAGDVSLVPMRDPRLNESLHHHNSY